MLRCLNNSGRLSKHEGSNPPDKAIHLKRMNTMNKCLCSALIVFSLAANAASAAVECEEVVNQVTVHSNGHVYFTTNVSCQAQWCELNFPDANQVNRGYSMLLTAKTSNKTIIFNWPSIASCGTQLPAYSSPDYMHLAN